MEKLGKNWTLLASWMTLMIATDSNVLKIDGLPKLSSFLNVLSGLLLWAATAISVLKSLVQ